jgi:hypothetical protein
MKYSIAFTTALAAAAAARSLQVPLGGQAPLSTSNDGVEKFLVEFAPGEERWITEEEKWALKRVRLPPLPSLNPSLILFSRKASSSWTSPQPPT